MSKALRAGILLITLAIPAFIILFLHGFGDNEFAIPVYYEQGVDSLFVECKWEKPHRVTLESNQIELNGHISVVAFSNKSSFELNDFYRINVDYESYDGFQSVLLIDQEIEIPERSLGEDQVIIEEVNNFEQILACEFVIDNSQTVELPYILIDENSRIRGYYYVEDDEELERLIHELNIIFDEKNE